MPNNYNDFLNASAPLEPALERESHGVAELGVNYRTNLNEWDGQLPPPRRANLDHGHAPILNLSGVGANPDGRGNGSRPTLSAIPDDGNIVCYYQNKVSGKIH